MDESELDFPSWYGQHHRRLVASIVLLSATSRSRGRSSTRRSPARWCAGNAYAPWSRPPQFDATILPDGVRIRELVIGDEPRSVLAMCNDATAVRVSISVFALGSQTPEEILATVPGGDGTGQRITLDGRPAVIGSVPERPNTPFVSWAVDGALVEIGGQNGTPVDQLIRVAMGLRPASVSQPPGIYLLRDGVLTRQ